MFLPRVLVVVLSPALTYSQGVCTPNPGPPCGQQLDGAVYPAINGQAALSNGSDMWTGCSCAGASNYQCVEFVKRFYVTVMNYQPAKEWHGNANGYFATAAVKGLQSFPNGGSVPPSPNDILVFDGDTYGHVAIVTSVTSSAITVIEQNWSLTGTADIPIQSTNGSYQAGPRPDSHYVVLGWLRLPVQSMPPPLTLAAGTLQPGTKNNEFLLEFSLSGTGLEDAYPAFESNGSGHLIIGGRSAAYSQSASLSFTFDFSFSVSAPATVSLNPTFTTSIGSATSSISLLQGSDVITAGVQTSGPSGYGLMGSRYFIPAVTLQPNTQYDLMVTTLGVPTSYAQGFVGTVGWGQISLDVSIPVF